jgi:ADP-heptose:LPS heptosyltransferase
MGRTDGFGAEILPDCRVMQKMIDRLKDRALIVQVGAGTPLYQFKGIEVDLANKTSVRELIDVGSICDGMLGYCSFILALAESLDKPAIMVWSRRGLQSKDLYIRQITPQKIIEKPSTKYVIDDCSEQEITEAIDGFLR